ncbi:MAG: VOC family protein [Clostridia bacterium]|nr:VOC family protein [Clostridia bacterium]
MKLSGVTIGTKHLEATIEFYVKILKFKLVKRYQNGPDLSGAILKHNNCSIEFITGDAVDPYDSKGIVFTFEVEDLEYFFNALIKHQVEVIDAPHFKNGVRIMHIRDCNGLLLGFTQLPS